MAIPNPQPFHNGIEYPYFSVELALSTRPVGLDMEVGLVVTLTPYRVTGDGVDVLTPYTVTDEDGVEMQVGRMTMVFGNARTQAQADPRLAAFLSAIETAGQQYILGGTNG
jgi:hypothetical protein